MSSFCKCKSHSHFFHKNISVYAIFTDESFNDTLTKDLISFKQLGPVQSGLILVFLRILNNWEATFCPQMGGKIFQVDPIISELPHDKTNIMDVCSAKTQISLGICPV